jgi:hypothetical protein
VSGQPVSPSIGSIICDPKPGTVWEVLSPTGEIVRVLIVEYFQAGEESPFAFGRCLAVTRSIGTTGPRDILVGLEPTEELVVAHCWLEGPIREALLMRCTATVPEERLQAINENREPSAPPLLSNEVLAFRRALRQKMNQVFYDSWRELYAQLGSSLTASETVLGDPAIDEINRWLTGARDSKENFALSAKGSNSNQVNVCTLTVNTDPETWVWLSLASDRVSLFTLLQRSQVASLEFNPLDKYESIEIIDDIGDVHRATLTAFPATVLVPAERKISSMSLVSKSLDRNKHSLSYRSS